MDINTVEYRWKNTESEYYTNCHWGDIMVRYENIDFENMSIRINKNRILHLYDEKLKEDYDKWYAWQRLCLK